MGAIKWGNVRDQRVGIFVDTENLYYASREFYGRYVNFESLLRFAVGYRRLVRATAYVVEQEGGSSIRPFVYKLSALGYRVRRRVRPHDRYTELDRTTYHGLWDMGIAADVLRLLPHLDVVVLGSGNGHFLELIEAVADSGRRVEVIAFKETTPSELVYAVDWFTHLPEIPDPFVPLREETSPSEWPPEYREEKPSELDWGALGEEDDPDKPGPA